MIFLLHTNDTQKLAETIRNWQMDYYPHTTNSRECGFYLTDEKLLYIDEHIDNEIVGQLDKLVCSFFTKSDASFEEAHRVLIEWEKRDARSLKP